MLALGSSGRRQMDLDPAAMHTRRPLVASITLVGSLVLMVTAGAVQAQSPTAPAAPQHPTAAPPDPADGAKGAPGQDGMMRMMEMCRLMATPMMGLGGDRAMDTKTMSRMLKMRGEMMKAMGEIMLKHGRMMQGAAPK